MQRALTLLIVAGLGLSLLAGCGSKVNKENFEKIQKGMTVEEVTEILGDPTDAGGVAADVGPVDVSAQTYTWEDGDKKITVTFLNGKVQTVVGDF